MTKFVFESNDGSTWTEDEKARAIARHVKIENLARERFEKARQDLIMKLIFKSDDNGGVELINKEN